MPPLREQDVDPDPIREFGCWFEAARSAGTPAPEAAALATAARSGQPSVRMVLVKRVDQRGFVFYTNYESRKGRELSANPRGALLFHWERLGRQVRAEGEVARTSAEETAAYARSRPPGSQLSALASPQSQTIASRAWLERRVSELRRRYGDGELPLPEHWGGFRLVPATIEFWQHGEDRLHDRLLYRQSPAGGWLLERLGP